MSRIVFVLGAPGSGKGTQSAKIVEKYGWKHLSTGDLLRSEVAAESELGQIAAEIMQRGEMVPTSLVIDLVLNAMTASENKRFLVDGFPRTLEQLQEFEEKIQPCDAVLVFTVPDEVAISRLLDRGVTSGREDDNEETIQKRLAVFKEESQPVIDALQESGRVLEVDAQADPEQVFQSVAGFMDQMDSQAAAEEAHEAEAEGASATEGGEAPDAEVAEQPDEDGSNKAAAAGMEDAPAEGKAPTEGEEQEAAEGEAGPMAEVDENREEAQAGDAAEGYEPSSAEPAESAVVAGEKDEDEPGIEQMADEEAAGEEGERPASARPTPAVAAAAAAAAAAASATPPGTAGGSRSPAPTPPGTAGGARPAGTPPLPSHASHISQASLQQRSSLQQRTSAQQQGSIQQRGSVAGMPPRTPEEEMRLLLNLQAYGEDEVRAVIKIQAAGRGMLARKEVRESMGGSRRSSVAQGPVATPPGTAGGVRSTPPGTAQGSGAAAVRATPPGTANGAVSRTPPGTAGGRPQSVSQLAAAIRSVLVVCGPSGVGKGTLINRLIGEYGDRFGFSVSHTTRGPRQGEEHGVHYHFTTHEAMEAEVAAGGFLEHAHVHGNMYGTSLAAAATLSRTGKVVVLDIDVQGAQAIKASAVADKATFLFIAPPSMEALEARLRGRGTESEEKVQLRLAGAAGEMAKAQKPGFFHATIVNGDSVEEAYQELKRVIAAFIPGTFAPEELQGGADRPASTTTPAGTLRLGGSRPATGAEPETPTMGPPPGSVLRTPPSAAASVKPASAASPPLPAPSAAAPPGTSQRTPNTVSHNTSNGNNVGPHTAQAQALPVRQYMDQTVVPILREALRSLNDQRPVDPLMFLSDYLMDIRATRLEQTGKP